MFKGPKVKILIQIQKQLLAHRHKGRYTGKDVIVKSTCVSQRTQVEL